MEHESDKDRHEKFQADCKRGRELAEARLKEITADSERRQKIAEAKLEKIKANSRRKRKLAAARIKELMTDSEWREEMQYKKSNRQVMWIVVMGMLTMWFFGVSFGWLMADSLHNLRQWVGLP